MTDPVREESIGLLYETMRTSLISGLIVTATVIGTAWPYTPWRIIIAWAAVQIVVQFSREVLVRGWRRRDPTQADLEWWARAHVLYMGVTGMMWGATMFLFAHVDDPTTVALTLCCLYGVSSGSVASQAPNPSGLSAMIVPIFLAVAVRLFGTGLFSYALLALASLGFAAVMTRFCRAQSRQIADGIRIRFENLELVEKLTLQKAEADRLRREAEAASLSKSQFLAAASHDLRQPLYALSLFSASLDTLNLDRDGRIVVSNIQGSIAAMEELFVSLLDVSRLDAGVVKAHRASVSVDLLFDRMSQYFRPVAIERGLDLRFRSSGEWLWSDVTLLEQVLSNLVSNALRSTIRGGVLVAARRRKDRVQLEIWDTGVGIDEADRGRIFDEFVQVDNPQRNRRKGLGLGLSIARRSALLLDSTISVASRRGRGSCFTITQPEDRSPHPNAAFFAAPWHEDSTIRAKPGLPVLVVDDDHDVRAALADLLTRWGQPFDMATDASEGLDWISRGVSYGLVMADYRLPGPMNGLEFIAAIRARQTTPRTACVLITGDFDPALLGAAQAQDVPVFHKPLRADRLRQMLGLEEASGMANQSG